jgi:hypothetical protein
MEVGVCPDKSLKGSKLHSLALTALYCQSAEPEGASMHHCSRQGPCTWGNRQQRSPMPTQPASACYQSIPPPKHSYTTSARCCFCTKQQSQLLSYAIVKSKHAFGHHPALPYPTQELLNTTDTSYDDLAFPSPLNKPTLSPPHQLPISGSSKSRLMGFTIHRIHQTQNGLNEP